MIIKYVPLIHSSQPLFSTEAAVHGYIAWHRGYRRVVDPLFYPRFRDLSFHTATVIEGVCGHNPLTIPLSRTEALSF